MDTNEVTPEQSQDNTDPSSAGPGPSNSTTRVDKEKRWKTAVFAIVVVLAGTLAARALLTAGRCGGGAGACKTKPACGITANEAGQKAALCSSKKTCCPGAQVSSKEWVCPLQKQTEKACTNSPSTPAPGCCPGAEGSSDSAGCPLAKQTASACPNSPGTPAPACCPGAGHRWGQK